MTHRRPGFRFLTIATNCTVRATLLLLNALLFASPVAATPKAVAIISPAAIADARAWNMTMAENGKRRTLTLRPDGTATMQGGVMTMNATWQLTANRLCVKPSIPMMSERCYALLARPGGYDALLNGSLAFQLRR